MLDNGTAIPVAIDLDWSVAAEPGSFFTPGFVKSTSITATNQGLTIQSESIGYFSEPEASRSKLTGFRRLPTKYGELRIEAA